MTVNSYLFQSPYSQPFQVGRPDPVATQEKSEEAQQEEQQVESETQNLSDQKSSFDQTQAQIKSSALYATSEGFGMSADQVKELSTVSKDSKRSDLARVYSNSG
jgi:dsDNA-specific endonuclease/ATPase MutS2